MVYLNVTIVMLRKLTRLGRCFHQLKLSRGPLVAPLGLAGIDFWLKCGLASFILELVGGFTHFMFNSVLDEDPK